MDTLHTKRRNDEYELHGETIADPYRWLEGNGEDVEAWVAEQNEYADGFLSGIPFRDDLGSRLEEVVRTTEYEAVVPRPDGYFGRVRGPDEDHSVLYVRETLDDERRELLDPNDLSDAGRCPSTGMCRVTTVRSSPAASRRAETNSPTSTFSTSNRAAWSRNCPSVAGRTR
jgi:protease II